MSFNPIQVVLEAQHYAALRARVHREDLGIDVPALYSEVHAWLTQNKIAVAGPSLIRYLSIDHASGTMDIHVGFPIAPHTDSHERVEFAVLPAGTYAIAVHRGAYDTLHKTTAMLLEWAAQQSVQWHTETHNDVTHWAGRIEHYLIGPSTENDPRHWHTEIAILMK